MSKIDLRNSTITHVSGASATVLTAAANTDGARIDFLTISAYGGTNNQVTLDGAILLATNSFNSDGTFIMQNIEVDAGVEIAIAASASNETSIGVTKF